MGSLFRELRFALQDKVVLITLLGTALLSSYSIMNGLKESADELATIDRVQRLVSEDRAYSLAKQEDAGGAAYYAYHFTYAAPTPLAFVARGIRDDLPWKHRIRMLALEGQIYETDSGNPELSIIGKLDFVFVAAFLLPLLSILLLYDLRAVEIRNNRWAFLSVTYGDGNLLLLQRAALRSVLVFIAMCLPLTLAATINQVSYWSMAVALGAVAINIFFWGFISLAVIRRIESGPTVAAILLGGWLAFAVVVPVGGKLLVEQAVRVPKGGEILLLQREAVNDAWDLPKDATMKPFYVRHPQWADSPDVTRPFEWKWYFAFQQVGDQSVESLSELLRAGITRRDSLMSVVAFASPPLLTKRLLSRAAKTDMAAFQHYDKCVRDYHSSLRDFYYPMFFGDVAYSTDYMQNLPIFIPCDD